MGLSAFITFHIFAFASMVVGDTVPPSAMCSVGNGLTYTVIPCTSAQYSSHIQAPNNIENIPLKFQFESNTLINGCDIHNMDEATTQNKVFVSRRGGCSFSDKASLASLKGYVGLIIVDYPDSTDTLVPNVEALVIPDNVEINEFIPISIVLISDEIFELHFDSEVLVSIKWESDWIPQDATSIYYDGIRLGKEKKYAEAADMHLRATQELPAFKSPAYEYVNNLLRAGTPTKDLIRAIMEVQVLPIHTEEGFKELEQAFSGMVSKAHDRIFRKKWSPVESLKRFKTSMALFKHNPRHIFDTVGSLFSFHPAPQSDVVVICVATDETPELEALRISVEKCGYQLVVLGLGAEYGTSGGTKLFLMEKWLLDSDGFEALNKSDDTVLLFVDAYDVLLMPSAKHLVQVFNSFNVSMVISGETGCWPDPGVAPVYPWHLFHKQPHFGHLYEVPESKEVSGTHETLPTVPFPYPNSGGYIGRAGYMRSMIVEVMDDVRSGHLIGGGMVGDADDQRWLQRHWLRHPREVAIDVMAEIFLSLHRLQLPLALGRTRASLRHPLNISQDHEAPPPREEVAPIHQWGLKTVWGLTAWMKLGDAAVTPLVLHGNGHGKRMFRVISCKLGLFCKWSYQDDDEISSSGGDDRSTYTQEIDPQNLEL